MIGGENYALVGMGFNCSSNCRDFAVKDQGLENAVGKNE